MHNFHGTTTQHIAWANHQRITDFSRMGNCLGLGTCSTVWRLTQTQFLQQFLESFTIFGHVDRFGAGTNNRYTIGLEGTRQFQRSLATILNNHAFGFFDIDDFKYVFKR